MLDPPAEQPPEPISEEEALDQLKIIVDEFMLTMKQAGFQVTRDVIDIRAMLMINISCVFQKEE